MLTVNDILALSRSGYSAAQIELIGQRLAAEDATNTEPSASVSSSPSSAPQAPQPAPAPATPAPQPVPAPAIPAPQPVPAPATPAPAPAAPVAANTDPALAGILAELRSLKSAMQAGNLAAAQQPQITTPSADDLLTAMVIPPQRKE